MKYFIKFPIINANKWLIDTIVLSLIISATLYFSTANAAIALDRTRIVFDGSQKSVSLNISNQNKQLPYLAQGWLEDENGNKIQTPFTVVPPVQRIEPGKSSQIKIESLPAAKLLKQDQEAVYYFNLREIPPKSSKPNTLQIALQTRVKLFYRPAGIAIDSNSTPHQEKLTMSLQGDRYLVNNPTPYYVTIVDASANKGKIEVKNFEPLMIPPKSSLPLSVNVSTLGKNPSLTYINDYGGRPKLNFICNTTCIIEKE